jgi:hypothetical protein
MPLRGEVSSLMNRSTGNSTTNPDNSFRDPCLSLAVTSVFAVIKLFKNQRKEIREEYESRYSLAEGENSGTKGPNTFL